MKKIFALVLLLIALPVSAGQMVTLGIAAGQKGSTTYEMVSEVAKICHSPTINVVASEGSLDNIARIMGDKNVQMGYSQEDALVYQQGIDPKMMEKILMVFPLFPAEIHIIVPANSRVRSLADLAGKKVIESEEGTGTWVTAQVIKAKTGIQWQAFNMSKKDSIKAIQAGMADAAIFVEGRPIDSLINVQGIRLLSISSPGLDGFKYYTKTLIPSGTYPWQQGSINTYKVNLVLMTYGFRNQYQSEIGGLVGCISHNLENLQQTGHVKWRDVNPLDSSIQWPIHPAAAAAIKRELRKH